MEQLLIELGQVQKPDVKIEIVNHIPLTDLMEIVVGYEEMNKKKAEEDEEARNNYGKNGMFFRRTGRNQEDILSDKFERIGRGSFGTVYGFKEYAIKFIRDTDDYRNRDVAVLKDISHLDCIPTLYAIVDNRLLITQRVNGKTISDATNDRTNELNIGVHTLTQVDKALKSVIKEGYSPKDCHYDNVMIDKDKGIIIVDVGFFVKHKETYDNFDDKTMEIDEGYTHAQDWCCARIKRFIREERERARLKEESGKRNDNAVYKHAYAGKGKAINVGGIVAQGNIIRMEVSPVKVVGGMWDKFVEEAPKGMPDIDIDVLKQPRFVEKVYFNGNDIEVKKEPQIYEQVAKPPKLEYVWHKD